MGIDKVDLKRNVIMTGNERVGNNTDGSMITEPVFTVENGAYVGLSAIPLVTQRGALKQNAFTWDNQQVSRTQFFMKNTCANLNPFHWQAFKHLDWVDTNIQELEGVISANTPNKVPSFQAGNALDTSAESLYNQLKNAPDQKEFNKILNDKNNKAARKQLEKLMGNKEFAKFRNLKTYEKMYSGVLNKFKTAQTALRNGQSLPQGMTFDGLGQELAQARVQEAEFIKQKTTVNGRRKGRARLQKQGNMLSRSMNKYQGWKNTKLSGSGKLAKGMRFMGRWGGKAGGALLIATSVVTAGVEVAGAVSAAKPGEGWKDGSRQALKSGARAALESGGAWAGMKLGIMIGSFGGPVGAFVGGLIGSAVGYVVGKAIADNTEFINKSVPQENAEREQKLKNEKICKAIDKGDLETVYNYTDEFKQQVVDEQGNPMTDEAGNPVVQIAKIYEDEKQQAEFEKRVKSLDNYVETEITKKQRAEALKQEKEAAQQQNQYLAQNNSYGYTPSYGSGTGYFGTTLPSYNFGSATNRGHYNFNFGQSTAGANSTSYSWQNPAWQQSLGQRFDSQNFYSFDPNNYTMPLMFQQPAA